MTSFPSQRDIVLILFPFSNLNAAKVRPVVVMSNDNYNKKSNDFIAVPLTSNLKLRDHVLLISKREMESGLLIVDSNAKVDRVFSLQQSLIKMKIGHIKKEAYKKLKNMLINIL
jgi:mRNA interferase MazF